MFSEFRNWESYLYSQRNTRFDSGPAHRGRRVGRGRAPQLEGPSGLDPDSLPGRGAHVRDAGHVEDDECGDGLRAPGRVCRLAVVLAALGALHAVDPASKESVAVADIAPSLQSAPRHGSIDMDGGAVRKALPSLWALPQRTPVSTAVSHIPDDPALHDLDVALEAGAAAAADAGARPLHPRVRDAGGDAALEQHTLPRADSLRRLGIDLHLRGLATLHLWASGRAFQGVKEQAD